MTSIPSRENLKFMRSGMHSAGEFALRDVKHVLNLTINMMELPEDHVLTVVAAIEALSMEMVDTFNKHLKQVDDLIAIEDDDEREVYFKEAISFYESLETD